MKGKNYQAIIATSIGKLGISAHGQYLTAIHFLDQHVTVKKPMNDFVADIVGQIHAFLKDPSTTFDIPYRLEGTEFQRRVWNSLKKIPAGKTCFYADVAKELNSSPRAVGGACRANPIPLVVPCHRVLSKSGLGGYDGDWETGKVNIKRWLLEHEGISVSPQRTAS
jgi:methylated-DNA-[protein]-cysteine S-methyltransferase